MRDFKTKKIFICSTVMFLFAIPAFAQENIGKVLQELQKKDIAPKKILQVPIIEKKKKKSKEVVSGKKIFIKKI